jgi:pyruvate ferredoxin oxidoreductase alpha subunit
MKAVRPFPSEAISRAVGGAKAVAVVDRDYSFGMGGILATEVASVVGGRAARYVAGLGGRDIRPEDFMGMAADALRAAESGDPAQGREVWWGLRRGAPGGQGGA